MKKSALAVILLSALLSHAALSDTISIRADEWFPVNGQPDSDKPGYMIELAKAVLESAGHTVDYKIMPWERALDSVRKGDHDCVVGAYKEDAPDFIFPETNWGLDSTGFFVKSGNAWQFTGMGSLLDKRVGIINGYAYGEEFDAFVTANPSVFSGLGGSDALDKNIRKLTAGRVDVVVESPNVMRAKLQEMGVNNVMQAGTLGEPSEMYIACSPAKPSSQGYIKLVNEGTETLRASGKLDAIMQRYGMSDWK